MQTERCFLLVAIDNVLGRVQSCAPLHSGYRKSYFTS